MSSRLARTLLKLYPRRVRDRYGAELLDLQTELEAQHQVSRARLTLDMLAGALSVRHRRERARLALITALVIVGLATAGALITQSGTGSAPRAAHRARVVLAISPEAGSGCFVGTTSCSLMACREFTAQASVDGGRITAVPPKLHRELQLGV